MIETLALVFVVISLCGLIGWLDYNNRKERSKLINALMARTPEQLRDLEFVDKVQPIKMETEQSDLLPLDKMTDEQFAEMVGANNA